MMSFASIIFGDPFFGHEMPSLVKLVLLSSAVHQLCYVATSTLPFAVGQVQDAGLIFLSSMARSVVRESQSQAGGGVHGGGLAGEVGPGGQVDVATTTAAVLWILGGATALLGAMLILIGRLRLASMAQYLPVPVVGGYLAFIGFYCGQAGLAMMGGVELVRLRDWSRLCNSTVGARVAPGFGVALAIRLCASKCAKSQTAKALVVPAVLAAAVVCMYLTLWLSAMSLDDARAAGWVGRVSGNDTTGLPWHLYLPSNPGVACRLAARALPAVAPTWVGMVVVVAFSSSLDVAAIEMELGRPLDYDSELRTVGLGNLCSGALGGFSGSYIFSQTILNMRSRVADRLSGIVVALVELGLVTLAPVPPTAVVPTCAFGGTLLLIAYELLEEWLWKARQRFSRSEYAVALLTFVAIHLLGLEAGFAAGLVCAALAFALSHGPSEAVFKCRFSRKTRSVVMRDFEQRALLSTAVRTSQIVVIELRGYIFFAAAAQLLAKLRHHLRLGYVPQAMDTTWYRRLSRRRAHPQSVPPPPKFAVLECSDFSGVDSTAARACFLPLGRQLKAKGVCLLFAALEPEVKRSLQRHGVSVDQDFDNLDAALEYAEDSLLATLQATRRPPPPAATSHSIQSILSEYVLSPHADDFDTDYKHTLQNAPLESYFQLCSYSQGEVLFQTGTTDTLYFIASGLVDFTLPPNRRILRVTRGGVCGELSFFLNRPQRFLAQCAKPTVVFRLDRANALRMRQHHPQLFMLLQTALLNTLCLQVEDSLGSAYNFDGDPAVLPLSPESC